MSPGPRVGPRQRSLSDRSRAPTNPKAATPQGVLCWCVSRQAVAFRASDRLFRPAIDPSDSCAGPLAALTLAPSMAVAIPSVPVSIVRNLYLLSEAFELVGRRLFGGEWNGSEYGMRPCRSPEDMLRARAPHVEALQRIEGELAEIAARMKRMLSESEVRELEEQRRVAFERRSEVHQQLFSSPEPSETIAWAYASYQRK